MLYNTKYRIWNRINQLWQRFKPECRHWYKVISSSINGRREIEVSSCRWCKGLTSELYVKGVPYDEHMDHIQGYGPVEACPVTEDPPPSRPVDSGTVITLPNRELYFERHSNVVETDRNAGAGKKASGSARRAKKPRTRP